VVEILSGDPVALAILEDAPVPVAARVGEAMAEGHAAPVKHGGKLMGAVLTLSEVSRQRREQTRLRQRERGEITARLAAGVANEYTNLIATIRNQAEQLLRQFEDYAPVSQPLHEIQQAAAAADRVTRRLEDIAGGHPGRPETLSLHGILRRMSRLIQSVAGERIKVIPRLAAANGKIFADAAQTEELVMRLIMHGVNAMPNGGELRIETADVKDRAGDQVSFAVSHTGEGADLDSVDIAITPYVSPEDERRLEAFFPHWQAPAPAAGEVATLLLVEPREGVRAQLHNFFEANGYNLLEAADDEQARTLAELQHVDLVIGATRPIEGVPLVEVAAPYTQRALLEQVRAALPPTAGPAPNPAPNPALTFSASAP
jgi:CheY-like chemotaxis protein